MTQNVCICERVHMYCSYININCSQTHIHKSDHWQCQQSFYCSFCWPLVPALLLAAAHPPFREAHPCILWGAKTSLTARKTGRLYKP